YDPQLKATETLDSPSMTEIRRRRFPSVMITDTVFADDIALISDNLDKAQSLPERVEYCFPLLLGTKHCRCLRRSPETTFIDQLESDTGLKRQDLASDVVILQLGVHADFPYSL
ncbi:unnamed protein product, partial [Porites lobata]